MPVVVRTCIGCRERAAKPDLVRLVLTPAGIAADPRFRAPGRGAYLHPQAACLDQAVRRRRLGRALRTGAVPTGDLERVVAPYLPTVSVDAPPASGRRREDTAPVGLDESPRQD